MCGLWKLRAFWILVAATSLVRVGLGQSSTALEGLPIRLSSVTEPGICAESGSETGVRAALRLVCLRDTSGLKNMAVEKAIIIGFVGGFVRSNDVRHPEVQFASYLQHTYPPEVHVEVFANHDGKHALHRVLQLLREDGDSGIPSREQENTRIITYGHSWGGSQAVTLAHELAQLEIPVSLTILVDSVHKPGHDDAVIPPNVRRAVNFYQTRGLIHGRSRIRASDPTRTNIVGNFQMPYQEHRINCENYPWIARHLNRPHHEIENDPVVWQQIASLIDSELFQSTSTVEASVPRTSVVGAQGQR
jgi:hypothetical protein